MSYIIGISAFYHDSSATLLKNGEIIASVEEEKFSRIKHDREFPRNSIMYCLEAHGLSLSDISSIIFYDKPLLKFERLLETYVSFAPFGWKFYKASLPEWFNGKIFLERKIKKELESIDQSWDSSQDILFSEHHLSHAASAFFPSPFQRAAVLCLDGVGEWHTASAWIGEGSSLKKLWSIDFPHSIGLLYSAFTYYLGFEVNNGEYKMMGLSPYGEAKYVDLIESELIEIKDDGSFQLNMSYFAYVTDVVMINKKFEELLGRENRKPKEEVEQFHMDVAASIQKVTEKIVIKLSRTLKEETQADALCLAGGVALNCVANGKLREEGIFQDIWVQPAAGDAGGSLGSAFSCWYQYLGNTRAVDDRDSMKSSLLGPEFSDEKIENSLRELKCNYKKVEDVEVLAAELLSEGQILGWFQGRAEFGPRALGNRSILGDPRNSEMQRKINLKIKYRESFRPFAPAVMLERASEFFSLDGESPYMLFTAKVKNSLLTSKPITSLFEKLDCVESVIPAVTHVDLSARVQTVTEKTNSKFYKLLSEFNKLTGVPVLVNTSFNIRGEPIVLTPNNAVQCFMNTEMDVLVLNNFILYKSDQDKSFFNHYTTQELSGIRKKRNVFPPVDKLELKSFGYQFTFILGVVVGLILPWVWSYEISYIPFILALVTLFLRFTFYKGLLLFYYPWSLFSVLLTFVKAKILLFVSYFLFISPIGIFMKLIGKDPILKSFLKGQDSYLRRSSEEEFDPQSLKHPF